MPGYGGRAMITRRGPLRRSTTPAPRARWVMENAGNGLNEKQMPAGPAGCERLLGSVATGTGYGGTMAAAVPRPTNADGAEAYSAMSAAGLLSGLARLAGAWGAAPFTAGGGVSCSTSAV